MNFRILFSTLFLMSTWTLSGQDWSLGMDMVSLSKFIGGEETPVILQIRRSFNERHALRLNLGAYHSHKRRNWDYLNTVNLVSVLNDVFNEINYTYSGRLGWEYSFSIEKNRFNFYVYSGILFDYTKNKREHILKDDYSIPTKGIPQEEVFIYPRSIYDIHNFSSGVFFIPGIEVKVCDWFSFSLESDISGFFYKEYRFESTQVWDFDRNKPSPPIFYIKEGESYDETGFQIQASALQYLFLRFTF